MKISGQVFDSKNEPLASANVTLISGAQSEKMGVVTNLDGQFQMDSDMIESESLFRISYIGFVPQVWSALALQDKEIILKDSIEELDEVIVINKKKPTLVAPVAKKPIVEHLKKYKTVYVGGAALAALLLITKIKK